MDLSDVDTANAEQLVARYETLAADDLYTFRFGHPDSDISEHEPVRWATLEMFAITAIGNGTADSAEIRTALQILRDKQTISRDEYSLLMLSHFDARIRGGHSRA